MLNILDRLGHRPSVPDTEPTALPLCEEGVWATLQDMPPFRFPDSDGAFSVALVGDDPLRLSFFKQIFSLCHIHRGDSWSTLHFHIISTDPVRFLAQLKAFLPQVLPYLWIENDYRLNDAVADLRENTAKTPESAFARLHLHYPADKLKNQWLKIRKNKKDTPLANYILLLNPKQAENEEVYKSLRDVFVDDVPCFIGIGNGALQDSGKNPALICRCIPLDGSCHDDAALTRLEQRALLIHTYYEKEYDQRKSREAIAESFGPSSSYNHRSSRRAALSISAKLHRCALPDEPESARALLDLLEVTTAADRLTVSSLLLMEHRSWQCFMLTEGWRMPTENELEHPASGAYTFSNPSHKLNLGGTRCHPCLAESQQTVSIPEDVAIAPEQLLPLSRWTPAEWDNPMKPLDKLDPLDRMSVTLHRLLNKRVREQFPSTLAHYRKELTDELEGDPSQVKFEELFTLSDRILAGEDNNDWQWNKLYAALPADTVQRPVISGYLTELRNIIRCAMERNAYRDYKKTDLDLLMALPAILDPTPAPVVYKLNAPTDWQNVVCSVMLEPSRLVLIYPGSKQREAEDNKAQYTDLFTARHSDTTVAILRNDTNIAPVANSVLDITGADPEQLLWAMNQPQLAVLPWIYYKDGALHSNDPTRFDPRRYARLHRWLTVRETLLLSGNKLEDNADTQPLLEMQQEYREYFDILREIDASLLHSLCEKVTLFGKDTEVSFYDNEFSAKKRDALQRLNNKLITNLQIQESQSPVSTVGKKEPQLSATVRFTYASESAKACLTKEGNILEALVYHTLLSSGMFDDVRVGVKVGWFADNVRGAATTNEVDVICTKGLRTYFISCKKTKALEQQYYPEVWYEAYRFGVDAVPILVWGSSQIGYSQTHINRGARMRVETIHLNLDRNAAACCNELKMQMQSILHRR